MNELIERIEDLIPKGDGYNSDYANTLAEAVDRIKELEERLHYNGLTMDINERRIKELEADLIKACSGMLKIPRPII